MLTDWIASIISNAKSELLKLHFCTNGIVTNKAIRMKHQVYTLYKIKRATAQPLTNADAWPTLSQLNSTAMCSTVAIVYRATISYNTSAAIYPSPGIIYFYVCSCLGLYIFIYVVFLQTKIWKVNGKPREKRGQQTTSYYLDRWDR